ncbi:MAG: MFS transporter [Gammaproteobacteria bacterium]
MDSKSTDWAAVGFGLALAAFAAYQQFKLPAVLPALLAEYGYDRTLAGGFMSIYAVAGLAFSVLAGRLLERHDQARLILGALALMAFGNLLGLTWPQAGGTMLVARGLEGIAFALFAIAGPVLANRNASAHHLPLVIGLTAAWIPAGQLIAILSAPVALARFGWQSLWWFGLFATAGLALWTLYLNHAGHSALNARPASGAGDAPTLTPTQRLGLLLSALIFFLWSTEFFAYMTWLPQYLVDVHGFSLNGALAGYALPVALVLVFNLIGGALLRAGFAVGPMLAWSLALQAAVWLSLPVTGGGLTGLVSLIAYGVGAGITPTCLFALPSRLVESRRSASAFAIIMTGRNCGVLLGPVLMAEAVKRLGSWDASGPLFGACTLLAMLLALGLAVRLR